jgi:uncharacterized protein GlcG (DUF336 family)
MTARRHDAAAPRGAGHVVLGLQSLNNAERQPLAVLMRFGEADVIVSVARIRADLNASVLSSGARPHWTAADREKVAAQLADVVEQMRRELQRLNVNSDHHELVSHVSASLALLAGGVIVISNGLILGGLTPITGGLSAGGAALSTAAGTEMITRGIDTAME